MRQSPRIIATLDKFKHGCTATEACEIVRQAVLAARADAEVILKPMADGGDGAAAVLHASLGANGCLREASAARVWEMECVSVLPDDRSWRTDPAGTRADRRLRQ